MLMVPSTLAVVAVVFDAVDVVYCCAVSNAAGVVVDINTVVLFPMLLVLLWTLILLCSYLGGVFEGVTAVIAVTLVDDVTIVIFVLLFPILLILTLFNII